MKSFFGKVIGNEFMLYGEEQKHLAVLRLKKDDIILGISQDEFEYTCKIKSIGDKQTVCDIVKKEVCKHNPKSKLTLFQAFAKSDKLELITQKITELGATDLVIFESQYTVKKPNQNTKARLERITLESCKQCGRSLPVKIANFVSFDQMLKMLGDYDLVLFAYEKDTDIKNFDVENYKNIAIIVGSEGGFSEQEVKKLQLQNVKSFGLGKRILRCETAAIFSVGLISYMLNN